MYNNGTYVLVEKESSPALRVLYVLLGGFLGTFIRVLVSYGFTNSATGLLFCNIVGCFLLGLGTRYLWDSKNVLLFCATGFCGGFTSYSAFALLLGVFLTSHMGATLILYILVSYIGSIAVLVAGIWVGKQLLKAQAGRESRLDMEADADQDAGTLQEGEPV